MADIKISELQNYRPVTDGLIVPCSYSTGTRADGTLRYKSAHITSEDLKIYAQSGLNDTYATLDYVADAISSALTGGTGGTETFFATKDEVKQTTDALDNRISVLEETTNDHLENYCGALDAKIEQLNGGLTGEITARTEGDANTLAAAKEYTDAEVAKVNVNDRMATVEASVTKNTSDINTLNGGKDVVGSVQYTVAQRVAEIIDDAPESFDTLKELAAWINTHGATAAGMQESITANNAAITKEIEDRKAADVALDTKLTQDIANAVANKAVKADVETAISTALETAKGYTDTQVSGKATETYVNETIATEIGKLNTDVSGRNYVTTSAMQTYVEGLNHASASQVAEDIAAAKSELSAVDTQLSNDITSLSNSLSNYATTATVEALQNALNAAVERIASLEAKLAKYDTRFGWTDAVLTDNNAWTKSFLLIDSDEE